MKRTIINCTVMVIMIFGAYQDPSSPYLGMWAMFIAGCCFTFELVCRVFKQSQYADALHMIDQLVRGENLYGRNHRDEEYTAALDQARKLIREER